jgi:cyclomaltodextrinase
MSKGQPDAETAASVREELLTRRHVLKAGAAGTAGLLATAPVARALRAAAERPALLPVSADVWLPSVAVTGGPAAGALSVDGATVTSSPSGGGFSATLPLRPGVNQAQVTAPGGRTAAQTYTARRRAAPTAKIALSVSGGDLHADATASTTDPYSGAALETIRWSEAGSSLGDGSRLTLRGPFADGEHYISCQVTDAEGRLDTATAAFTASGGAPEVPAASWQPGWIEGAVVYGAIPPLFGTPPLQAVTAALDRLASLGVTVLWLSPIFATVPGDFGYAVTDHFTVRPDYGDLPALQELVAEAHDRGLRVILDMPINDTSTSHPYFAQAKRFKQAESRYWDFYERDSHGAPVHYFSWRKLPNLSYDSAEVRRIALEAAGYWIREAGVDGFRCDAAWGIAARAPGFWREWSAEVRRIRPDALLLAEAPARSPQYSEEGFGAAYDWGGNLGEWAWQEAFAKHGPNLAALRSALGTPLSLRPFRFLENNDTGSRFITRNGAGLTSAALALLLSLPGLPCIYTGEEIGAEYLPYQQSRPLAWTSDPHAMEPLIAHLTGQRAARPALQRGTVTLLTAEPAASVIAFTAALPGETVLVAVNFTGQPLSAEVALSGGGTRSVPLEPYGFSQLAE